MRPCTSVKSNWWLVTIARAVDRGPSVNFTFGDEQYEHSSVCFRLG